MIVISKGDLVLYKAQDGKYSLYKALDNLKKTPKGVVEVSVAQIGSGGNITNKKFTTSIFDKNGNQRVFRSWIQPGDKVRINTLDISGEVFSLYSDESRQKDVWEIIVEIKSVFGKQYIYPMEEAKKVIEILN